MTGLSINVMTIILTVAFALFAFVFAFLISSLVSKDKIASDCFVFAKLRYCACSFNCLPFSSYAFNQNKAKEKG